MSSGHVQSQAARQISPDVNINIYDDVSTSQVPNIQLTININHYHNGVSDDVRNDVGDDVTGDDSDDELFDVNDDVWDLPSRGFVKQKKIQNLSFSVNVKNKNHCLIYLYCLLNIQKTSKSVQNMNFSKFLFIFK